MPFASRLRCLRALALLSVLSRCRPAILYTQPAQLDVANASLVRVNPGADAVSGTTVVDFWRVGAGPLASAAWPLGPFTGSPAPGASTRGLLPAVAGSCAISYAAGVFGAVLNTQTDAIAPGQTLGTITIEQSWPAPGVAAPWAAGGSLDASAFYQVPTARRETGAIAVYSSWTLGIRSAVDNVFIWYETALFDLDRPLGGDELWHDTISGDVIIHGVLGAASAFHTAAADSAAASTSAWAGFRKIHFTVSAAQVSGAIAATNAKFNLSLDVDASAWSLVHFNVELEGTANVSAGHSLHSLTLTALPAAQPPLAWSLGPEALAPYPSPAPYQFPDAAFSVQDVPAGIPGGPRLMFWSDGNTYRVVGDGLFPSGAPTPLTPVLGAGPPGTYDGNGNWLLAAFPTSGAGLVAFTHVENHRFDCPGGYAEWNAAAVVSSDDGGVTWRRDGLAISDPQPCAPAFGGAGYSSVLPAPRGAPGFLAYGGCTAFMSTHAAGAPGTWLRWRDGAFSSPGVNGTATCLPGVPANACCPIVSFNDYLQRYIMIYTTWGTNGTLFIATSADGLAWGPSQVLLAVPSPRAIAYGQLIGEHNSSVSGRVATLAYAAAPPTGSKPRDFVFRTITFG